MGIEDGRPLSAEERLEARLDEMEAQNLLDEEAISRLTAEAEVIGSVSAAKLVRIVGRAATNAANLSWLTALSEGPIELDADEILEILEDKESLSGGEIYSSEEG